MRVLLLLLALTAEPVNEEKAKAAQAARVLKLCKKDPTLCADAFRPLKLTQADGGISPLGQ